MQREIRRHGKYDLVAFWRGPGWEVVIYPAAPGAIRPFPNFVEGLEREEAFRQAMAVADQLSSELSAMTFLGSGEARSKNEPSPA
jgi:hypothetical protein